MQVQLNRLEKAYSNYTDAIDKMSVALTGKVDFEFYIEHQASDGFVLGNKSTNELAPLDYCISNIKNTGVLTEEDHNALSI